MWIVEFTTEIEIEEAEDREEAIQKATQTLIDSLNQVNVEVEDVFDVEARNTSAHKAMRRAIHQ